MILRHHQGLAARPPVRYKLRTEGSKCSLPFVVGGLSLAVTALRWIYADNRHYVNLAIWVASPAGRPRRSEPERAQPLGKSSALLTTGSSRGRTGRWIHQVRAQRRERVAVRQDRLDSAAACSELVDLRGTLHAPGSATGPVRTRPALDPTYPPPATRRLPRPVATVGPWALTPLQLAT